jgi:hypothetical protein
LIPALKELGALVVYVDLWSDTQTNPAVLMQAAIRQTLEDLQKPTSSFLQKLKRVTGIEVGALGFNFGFKLESVGAPGGLPLAQALTEVVDQAKTDVVLIVDEVQHAMTSEDGNQMLFALKAARDAINPRPDTPGHFIFIGTGSHRAMVSEMSTRRNQAFAGATSIAYPVLEADYVEHLLQRLRNEAASALPSVDVAMQAFKTLGHRPEEMLKALRQLNRSLSAGASSGASADDYLPVIAATLRFEIANMELMKLEQLGALARAVFERIAVADGESRGIYSAEALVDYTRVLGREVRTEETQRVVNELLAANLILRTGHGFYGVTDPFVQEIWREKKALEGQF